MKKTIIIVALCLPGFNLAQAEPSKIHGTWNCEATIMSQARGQRPFNLHQSLQLSIQPNGAATYSGTETVSSGSFPFEGEGRWQMQGTDLIVTGVIRGGSAQIIAWQSGFPSPPGSERYTFATKPQSQNYMSGDEQRGDKNNVMARIATQCQR